MRSGNERRQNGQQIIWTLSSRLQRGVIKYCLVVVRKMKRKRADRDGRSISWGSDHDLLKIEISLLQLYHHNNNEKTNISPVELTTPYSVEDMHGASGGDMGEDPSTKRMMKWTYTYGCFLSALKGSRILQAIQHQREIKKSEV